MRPDHWRHQPWEPTFWLQLGWRMMPVYTYEGLWYSSIYIYTYTYIYIYYIHIYIYYILYMYIHIYICVSSQNHIQGIQESTLFLVSACFNRGFRRKNPPSEPPLRGASESGKSVVLYQWFGLLCRKYALTICYKRLLPKSLQSCHIYIYIHGGAP